MKPSARSISLQSSRRISAPRSPANAPMAMYGSNRARQFVISLAISSGVNIEFRQASCCSVGPPQQVRCRAQVAMQHEPAAKVAQHVAGVFLRPLAGRHPGQVAADNPRRESLTPRSSFPPANCSGSAQVGASGPWSCHPPGHWREALLNCFRSGNSRQFLGVGFRKNRAASAIGPVPFKIVRASA